MSIFELSFGGEMRDGMKVGMFHDKGCSIIGGRFVGDGLSARQLGSALLLY